MPKEKILIADDEPHVLSLCKRIVEREGYQATEANSGPRAIAIAREQPFDLFLTDIMMPGMSGLDAAQAIREFQPDIVSVAMTGYGTMETAVEALKLGFSWFVEKPFKPGDLIRAINRALEKERLRRENARLHALIPLFELTKILMTNVNPDELSHNVLYTACSEIGADMGVLVLNDKNRRLHVKASVGFAADQIPEPLINHLLDDREQILIQTSEQASGRTRELLDLLQIDNLLFNPLLAMDSLVGALLLVKSTTGSRFAPGDSELMSVLCGQAAIALQNARLFDEIQQAYKELQVLDHMKSEFINIAAHELRTPLAILMGHATLLEDEVEDQELKERLQIIVRNGLRLRDLIAALLDMRHLQTGESRVNISSLDLEELITDVLEDFRLSAARKAISLSAQLPSDLPLIQSDKQKVHIVLSNLLLNAIEFTPAEGQVCVIVQDQEQELWVSVRDTGVGVPENELENIFRPFYQVEDSLTREHNGMGLGLSITEGMVKLCGGRIWVESKVGKGSQFTFSIKK